MSAKAVREVQSLAILRRHLDPESSGGLQLLNFAAVETLQDLETIPENHPWVLESVNVWRLSVSVVDDVVVEQASVLSIFSCYLSVKKKGGG